MSCAKPQVSTPKAGTPDICMMKDCEMERYIAPHLASLSPPQCPVYCPLPRNAVSRAYSTSEKEPHLPANVLREIMKGLLRGRMDVIALYVALAMPILHKLCTSYSAVLSRSPCVASRAIVCSMICLLGFALIGFSHRMSNKRWTCRHTC